MGEAFNRARRQSGFPTVISCQRQDPNVAQATTIDQGDKLCNVSTVDEVGPYPADLNGEPHWTDVTSRRSIGERTVYYFISEVPHFYREGARGAGGGALAILCVLGMCRPQGYVFTISVWEGCCF